MIASTTEALQARLQEGAAAMGLELSAPQLAQLMEFLALLQKWNKVYNLTAVRDPQEMLTHHLLDSLAAVLPLRRHLAQLAQSGVVQGRGCACSMWDPAVACPVWCLRFAAPNWM